MSDPRWYFTEEQLANSPSRKCGINAELELSYRQRAANLIQEMGQRLQVSQLCINTAIVYMHRFYAFHSFTMFHRNSIAAAAFFLAAKVEEQPRKLEHVIKILNICLEKTDSRDTYAEQAQELVLNENILLQTLGFDVAIDHPHTHVVKACQLFNIVTVSRELRQTCYFMASNSLHLTTMCLKYRPTVVAAFCIYIACKWSRWEIPDSSEGKAWYSYVDETVTLDTLKKLTDEYLQILDRSPSKFKSKMKAITSNGQAGLNQSPGMGDGPSTTHFKSNQHDKHHHHHHHHKSMSSSATNNMNVNANGNSRTSSSSSSSSKAQMHQMSSNSSSSSQYNKLVPPSQSGMNAVPPAASSSNHNMHRQRPPSSSSQQPYPSSNNKPPLMDERSHQQQQRMMHQDGSFYNSSTHPPKPRTSTSNPPPPNNPQQQPPLPPLPQQPPQQQPRQPYMKLGINDQKQQHNLMGNSSKQIPPYPPPPTQGMDMHQKNMKQNSTDYHGRSNSMNPQMNQQIPNNPQKKPPWSQQQQQQQPSMSQQQSSMSQQQQQVPSHNQDSNKYQHLQKNLQMPNNVHDQSASNLMNSSKYNDMSSKQQQQQSQQQVTPQNDFWFNDKINEMSTKTATPPRQVKSLFSPSPEHDSSANEKTMFNMVADSLKRHSSDNVDSPKDDRKSSIQTKRDKGMLVNSSQNKPINPPLPMPIPSSQVDKKFSSKMDSILNSHSMDMKDSLDSSQMMKKRPYGSIKDEPIPGRENKIRKVDHVKLEPTVPSSLPVTPSHPPMSSKNPQQSHSNPPSIYGAPDQTIQPTKQPIETNPDIVKSLLQECFSSSKYDDFDADLKNPELPDDIFADTVVVPSSNNNNVKNSNNNIPSNQQPQLQTVTKQESIDDLLDIKEEKMDSSAGEGSRKDHKKKSKKKKEKHKHKKKHKSSDRDEKSDSSSIKIIFSKDSKSDSKSSPESYGGGLKIKIPINKDAAASLTPGSNKNDINPAPIKLKISKEKFGNFANNPINTSSSTSTSSHHHKSKKDKDREKSKSKSSKHHSSSDYQHST